MPERPESTRLRLVLLAGAVSALALCAPAALAAEGGIRITCGPGAQVYIDEVFAGETSAREGGLVVYGVPEGEHVVKAVRPGFVPMAARIVVKPGLTSTVLVKDEWIRQQALPTPAPSAVAPPPAYFRPQPEPSGPLPPEAAPRRGPIRKFINPCVPILAKPTQQWSDVFFGGGLEVGFPVHRMTSLSGFVFHGVHSLGDLGRSWMAFDVGARFAFGPRTAKFILRPGLVVSRVSAELDGVKFNSTGAGVSGLAGWEFHFSPNTGMGFFVGVHYLLAPHKGEEQTWEYTGTTYVQRWVDAESRYSIFTGMFFRVEW